MKIAYCVPIGLHHPSGMERVLTCKANWLATHGCEVHIILTDITGEEPAFPLDKAVHIHQLNVNLGETRPYRFLKRAWLDRKKIALLKRRLNECLCQIRPDITISVIQREIDVISQMADGSIKIGEAHFPKEHIWNFVNYPARLPNSIRSLYNNHCRIRFLRKLSRFIVLTNEDAAASAMPAVRLVPNPADDVFALQGADAGLVDEVLLFNTQGCLLKSWPAGEGYYEIGALESGLYMVAVRMKDGCNHVLKLMVR